MLAAMDNDVAEVTVLENNLHRSDELSREMSEILTTMFAGRLGKLENSVKPIYSQTKSLSAASESRCLSAIIG